MWDWFNEHCTWFLALGLGFVVIGLIQSIKIVKSGYLIVTGLCLVLLGAVPYYLAVQGNPGNQPFNPLPGPSPSPKPEVPSEPISPSITKHQIDVLRTSWNSEDAPNWQIIECLAEVSVDSYLPPVLCIPALKKRGFDSVDICVIDSMICYVLRAKNLTVIAYRGTDDPYDWITNADETRFPLNEGFMHRGFWDAYQKLKQQISLVLTDDRPEYLWVTGHSLGGALAGVCAFDTAILHGGNLTGVVTFGQPRFADIKLTKSIDKVMQGKYLRLINNRDPVTRIPPKYEFCGVALWFTSKGILRSIPNQMLFGAGPSKLPMIEEINEPPAMSEQEYRELKRKIQNHTETPDYDANGRPLMKSGKASQLIDDHFMDNYLMKIREQIPHP